MRLASAGICPTCSTPGRVGAPCTQPTCQRWSIHFIPESNAERHSQRKRDENDVLLGRRFGDYLLVDKLGSGGFGRVYLALQLPIGMRVALKVLRTDSSSGISSDELRERFQREAEALAELNHPNIVRLIVYGVHDGTPYLVTELVNNARTLRQAIRERAEAGEPFRHSEIRHILHQSLNALQAAHERGIVHRDIKPENIMLQEVAGEPHFVRVLDFGLAKFVDKVTITGMVLGTPTYIAPEQLQAGEIGPWTDLYALAVVMFRMVFGVNPFGTGGSDAIVAKKLDPGFDPLCELAGRTIDPRIEHFFRKALTADTDARYGSVEGFRKALDRAIDAMDGIPTAATEPRRNALGGALRSASASADTSVVSTRPRRSLSPPPLASRDDEATQAASYSDRPVAGGGLRFDLGPEEDSGAESSSKRIPPPPAYPPERPGAVQDSVMVDTPKRTRILFWAILLVSLFGAAAYGLTYFGLSLGGGTAVTVTANVSGATFFVDGEEVGTSVAGQPVEIKFSSDSSRFEVRREGYISQDRPAPRGDAALSKWSIFLEVEPASDRSMARIPGGEVFVGCEEGEDCPVGGSMGRITTVPTFEIDREEVAVRDYKECVKAGACKRPKRDRDAGCNYGRKGRTTHPVNCVDWEQAQAYCEYRGKRLPTALEFEKAARGGCEKRATCDRGAPRYPWGEDTATCERANFDDGRGSPGCGSEASTWPAGSAKAGASPYSAYDLVGNVWEYVAANGADPTQPLNASTVRLRGGGYLTLSGDLGAQSEQRPVADEMRGDVGFRCAKTPEETASVTAQNASGSRDASPQ